MKDDTKSDGSRRYWVSSTDKLTSDNGELLIDDPRLRGFIHNMVSYLTIVADHPGIFFNSHTDEFIRSAVVEANSTAEAIEKAQAVFVAALQHAGGEEDGLPDLWACALDNAEGDETRVVRLDLLAA